MMKLIDVENRCESQCRSFDIEDQKHQVVCSMKSHGQLDTTGSYRNEGGHESDCKDSQAKAYRIAHELGIKGMRQDEKQAEQRGENPWITKILG